MSDKDKITVIIRGIDRPTWTRFRIICLEQNLSANEMVKVLVGRTVKEAENAAN